MVNRINRTVWVHDSNSGACRHEKEIMERQEKAHLEDGLGGSQKRMVKARREKTDQRRKVCCSFRSSICLVFEAREDLIFTGAFGNGHGVMWWRVVLKFPLWKTYIYCTRNLSSIK